MAAQAFVDQADELRWRPGRGTRDTTIRCYTDDAHWSTSWRSALCRSCAAAL
jgi:hypothetical protein